MPVFPVITLVPHAGFIQVELIHPKRDVPAQFMDMRMALTGTLKLPVTGLFGPSYLKAVRSAAARTNGVSAAALPVFTATAVAAAAT